MRAFAASPVRAWILAALFAVAAPGRAPAEETYCARALHQRILLESPPAAQRPLRAGAALPVNRLTGEERDFLRPELEGANLYGKPVSLSVRSEPEFDALEERLRDKGFWIVFNPSGSFMGGLKVGHFSLLVDGILFSRSFVDAGPGSLVVLPWKDRYQDERVAGMLRAGFYAAQFFELDPEAVARLRDFGLARSKGQLSGDPAYLRTYKFRPFSKYAALPGVENCATFCFSWADPSFVAAEPGLGRIAAQVGPMPVAEMPNVQLGNNPEAPGYRGTILVGDDATEIRRVLLSPEIHSHPAFHQLLMAAPFQPVAAAVAEAGGP